MSCFLNCSAGLSIPTILVVYDEPSDELRISSSLPTFVDVTVYLNCELNTDSFTVGSSPTDAMHLIVPGFSGYLVTIPDTLIGINFTNTGSPLPPYVATWTGSVPIT